MEPKFQTSFIPKKPINITGGQGVVVSSGGTDIFSVAAVIIFVLTLAACGGLFAYKKILANQIAQTQKDLAAAEAAFEPEVIQQIIDSSSRINSAKRLLKNHIMASAILDRMQVTTLKRMRFKEFSYENDNNKPSISILGETLSYNSLSGQADVFARDVSIVNPEFTDFGLSDLGMVTFKFNAEVDPNLTSYEKSVGSGVQSPSPI